MFVPMKRFLLATASLGVAGLLSGCSCIQEIGGAYFPAWLISILIGWILTGITRFTLIKVGLDGWIRPRSIGYPSLIVFFTLLIYLIFFTH
jgi:hypothetical protein